MAQDGVVTTLTIARDAAGKVTQRLQYQPTHVDHAAGMVVERTGPNANPASYRRTVAAMRGDGGCDATPAG